MFERSIPSMKAIFNSRTIEHSDHLLKTGNRAFCYGDGLFETIVTGEDRINLIDYHLQRLKKGCEVLGIKFPNLLSNKKLAEMIAQLKAENGISGATRTKLILWRNEGGLYTPNQSSASFYLEVKPHTSSFYQEHRTIGISKNLHTLQSPISFAKTTNALTYVMAGREKNERGLDEIILTDIQGNLSETHISNLFWTIDEQIFTPKLDTGCINGVMRTYLMEALQMENNPVKEVMAKPEALFQARHIFTTNASAIKYFSCIEGQNKVYQNPLQLLMPFLKRLPLP